jgi:hypothetical protein
MKIIKSFIICIIACAQLSHGEDITLVVERAAGQPGEAATESVSSGTITLNQGDTARLIFCADGDVQLLCTLESKTFTLNSTNSTVTNPVAIAGPATIEVRIGYSNTNFIRSGFATFSITRAGIASPPASIPQEAGTTWDVILESSSDLVNWTLANPGEYTGTGPKRFFRTRIVKKP